MSADFEVQPPCSRDAKPSDFHLWEHVKPLMYSGPVGNEQSLHQCIVIPAKPFATAQGPWKVLRQSPTRRAYARTDSRGRAFRAVLANCDLTNNNKSTVIKLGKCTVFRQW